MELRYYQREAIDATYKWMRVMKGNPCIVLPTGAGKTPVLATIVNDVVNRWGGRVLVMSHVKELLEQAELTIRRWYSTVPVGVYSAGLGRRETQQACVIAGIQSIAANVESFGAFDIILVDECHRIPPEGEGRYGTVLEAFQERNPKTRLIGLTATPYRTGSGSIIGSGHILHEVSYTADVGKLIEEGYLSKISSKAAEAAADMRGVRIQNGDFVAAEMEERFASTVGQAVLECIHLAEDRKKVLIFAAGVSHAEQITHLLRDAGQTVGLITGDISDKERSDTLWAFRSGALRWLVNVNVLTEGFDASDIDMIGLLRATVSPGLYYQMVGRGLRINEAKEDCRIVDFGENVMRHGPIDAIRVRQRQPGQEVADEVVKVCPKCREYVPIALANCTHCDYEFPKPEREETERHEAKAKAAAILTSQIKDEVFVVDVVDYKVHKKYRAEPGTPRTMRVTYMTDKGIPLASEWVCVEHSGFPRIKAEQWWAKRCKYPMPKTVEDAVSICQQGGIAEPYKITLRTSGQYPEIVKYELSPIPEGQFEPKQEQSDWEEVPF